jgi:shikimate dehydrogenase
MAESSRFVLLGHPVRHSLSPLIHAAAIHALGLPHTYTAIDVPNESSLRRVINEIRRGSIVGGNVTLPYKKAVLDMVDAVAPSAAEIGAANVLVRERDGRVVAHNTDAEALADDLGSFGSFGPASRAVIIGAGGAGLAAVAACKRLGFRVIGLTTRSWTATEVVYESAAAEAARALGALTSPWPSLDVVAPTGKASQVMRLHWRELALQAHLVIQATSAGMEGVDSGENVAGIVPWTDLRDSAVAYDVVYNPRVTPFLREAARRGLRSSGGLGMLVRQAALSHVLWTGVLPPIDVMRKVAESSLENERTGPR